MFESEIGGIVISKNTGEEISSLCKVRRIKIQNVNSVILDDGKDYKLVVDLTPAAEKLSRIMTDESELHRILQILNPVGVETTHKTAKGEIVKNKYRFFNDMIILKVGKSGNYLDLIERGNIKRKPEDIGTIEIRTFKDSEKQELEKTEIFKHLIVNASHIRGQKGIFVNTAYGLYDKVDEILRCGISKDTKTEYISKWTSYYGLQASNSTPVTMPKCVCVDDLDLQIADTVDIVKGTIKNECVKEYKRKPNVYADVKHFEVINNQEQEVPTCPFDGMGIVDVSMAKQWSDDLGLNYIPGSFQVRLCGVKGCLFVMDIEKYISEMNGGSGIITDIDDEKFDYFEGEYNVILTKSMFKYGKFYDTDKKFAQWKKEFHKKIYGYERTFNICSYAKNIDDLQDEMLGAYQPLQSLPKLENIEEFCSPTVDALKGMHTDIDRFLYYIGIKEVDEDGDINMSAVPPYYQALYYNHSLANDTFIRDKIENSLKRAVERSYAGKLYLKGNYTVVGSDPFALLQWAFTLDESKVTGLLKNKNQIYSNYWNRKKKEQVNVWRNPHIFTEHWVADCVNNSDVREWFKYLHSNIIVSVWDTNLLRMNSADTDGDILASVDNEILKKEVKRALENGEANTIYPILEFGKKKSKEEYPKIGNIEQQIISENNGFKNDIGSCTNIITELWGIPQSIKSQNYLKIMSVVDSLVIDFPKTSEKTDTPAEIKKFKKDNDVKKQEFMMYLPANKKLRKKEEHRKDGEKSFFSHDSCTVNKICCHMREQMKDVKVEFKDIPEFDFKSLLITTDSTLTERAIYKLVCEKMATLYKQQEQINRDKRNDEKAFNKEMDYTVLYTAFYDSCRNDILLISEEGKYVSKDIIIDCCILWCYTEKFNLKKNSVYNLLWNMFPQELIQRVKGNCRKRKVTQEQIKTFKQSVEKKLEYSREQYEKETANKKINRIKDIPCLQDTNEVDGKFEIYRDDISGIKKAIRTNEKDYNLKRRLLFVLLVIDRKIKALLDGKANIPFVKNSKKAINISILSEILGITDKSVEMELEWLKSNHFIDDKNINELKICYERFGKSDIDRTVVYFSGTKYISAFKIMNRHLKK